ncbi:MAG: lipid-A-disaccharide synthase [Desulfobacterales bacterium]
MRRSFSDKYVMLSAGEASGDFHGANVVKVLKKKAPDLHFIGIGGDALKEQGVQILVDSAKLSVVGITEVFTRLPYLLKAVKAAKMALRQFKPELLILIDFPDFNLFLAGIAKKLKIPVLYYISPQVWAWRSGRVKKIRRLVDHMAVILPFEADFYRKYGVKTTFVGHPLLDSVYPISFSTFENNLSEPFVLGLLPGSRDREISNHLPVMLEAAKKLKESFTDLKVLVSLASSVNRNVVEQIMEPYQGTLDVKLVEGGAVQTFKRSAILVAVSGTVTLEAALSGIPMVIIYRVSPLSYRLGKALIRVKFISLVNLIARRQILPELIQQEASPGKIAANVEKMLKDSKQLIRIHQQLFRIRNAFGQPGASGRVADIALDMIKK